MCFVCSLANQHTVFKWKDAISAFPVSQGSAEPLDRWGRKTMHRLISYFLSNTSAKNYRNRIMYVKIIASQTREVFWDSVYSHIENTYVHTNEPKHGEMGRVRQNPIQRTVRLGLFMCVCVCVCVCGTLMRLRTPLFGARLRFQTFAQQSLSNRLVLADVLYI